MFIYGQKLPYHSDSLCVTFTLLIVPSVSFSKTLTRSPATIESSKDTFFSFSNPGFKLDVETSPSILFSPFFPEEEQVSEGEVSKFSCNSFGLFQPPDTGGSCFPFLPRFFGFSRPFKPVSIGPYPWQDIMSAHLDPRPM